MSDNTNNTNTKTSTTRNQSKGEKIQPVQKWKIFFYNIIEKDNTKLADIIYAWG